MPVGLVIDMMRSLKDKDFAVAAFESGNAKPALGIAKQAVSERIGEKFGEGFAVVDVSGDLARVAQPRSQAAIEVVGKGRKDLASPSDIEVKKIGSAVPGTEAEGNDATGRVPAIRSK
ncbi:MAG: hypothetical protein A49_22120 [Methyloceanibacter sp.]|nr:MAG: hypothetical protein A49_22120 [Methyloceanibacter sp.]